MHRRGWSLFCDDGVHNEARACRHGEHGYIGTVQARARFRWSSFRIGHLFRLIAIASEDMGLNEKTYFFFIRVQVCRGAGEGKV